MIRRAFLLAIPAVAMTGCAVFTKPLPPPSVDPLDAGLQAAVDRVHGQLVTRNLLTDDPVIVLTFQELRSLADPMGFGKVCAEQTASRLVAHNVKVIDLRYTGFIKINERNGETVLSREASQLATSHKAKIILTGTYVVLGGDARVSIRAVSATEGIVLASSDFHVPADYVRRLLG